MNNQKPIEYLKFRELNEKAIQMLITGECYYSSPLYFNDPLDCSYSLENFPYVVLQSLSKIDFGESNILHDFHSILFKKNRHINHGVVSFCGRYSDSGDTDTILNPDLWGHYGDNHKGICIGFSPNNDYFNLDISSALNPVQEGKLRRFQVPTTAGSHVLLSHITSRPHWHNNLLSSSKGHVVEVSYREKYMLPEPNWEVVRANFESFDKNNIKSADQLLSSILENSLDVKEIVSNKHNNWANENEYRLFGTSNKSQSIGAAIVSVTFGLETSEEVKRYIVSLVSRFYGIGSVGVYKIIIDNRRLARVPLEFNDSMPQSSQSTVLIE